jgi:two-component system nitrogen regulation response regulator GlnG/two-component system response regulator HydG
VSGDVTLEDDSLLGATAVAPREVLTMVVVWCTDDPAKVGTIAFLPADDPGPNFILGRGPQLPEDPDPRLTFGLHRPSGFEAVTPLAWRKLSRVQLRLRANGAESLDVENLGRCQLFHNGIETRTASVVPGDVLRLGSRLLLLCARRSERLPAPAEAYRLNEFGEPDGYGIVGESPAVWKLRQQLAYAASRTGHVLISGESGTGKELAARAIHALSRCADKPLVARNAATIPEGIADAELFGNIKDYPNVGMPTRLGLLGEADGTTLFLDEFAEVPVAVQPRLLRVLDDGEYQRLGSARPVRSAFRLVAATNRPDSALRHDLLARFRFRIKVPDLGARREDIPFLVRHLLSRLGQEGLPDANALVSCEQMTECVRKAYRTNVRQLEAQLWAFASAADAPPLDATSEAFDSAGNGNGARREAEVFPLPESADPQALGRAEIQRALDRNNGLIESTWRALGLKNRHVLARLMAKHGVEVRRKHGK